MSESKRLCDSCGESEVCEPHGLYCCECTNIIKDQLSKGHIYIGIGNVKLIKKDDDD